MLIEIRQLSPNIRLGLWRMDEPCEGTPRQRERHAVQMLLTAMMGGDTTYGIGHEPSGKPFLTPSPAVPSPCLSISHTHGYAALLLSSDGSVGIDIERRSDRVERIASRFIRPDEQADTTDEKLLLWSAKETVYKRYSEDQLAFFDMRALPTATSSKPGVAATEGMRGAIQVENTKRGELVTVYYEFTTDYVLTYLIDPPRLRSASKPCKPGNLSQA